MITVETNQVKITDWIVADQDVVAFFTEIDAENDEALQQEYGELLLRALKIGVVALQRARTRVDLDVIRREFDSWQTQVQDALNDVFKEDKGALALALSKYLGEGGKLADLFDPERKGSAIGRIQAIFDDHFDGDKAKFARLLDYTETGSPLEKLHKALEKKFDDVDTKLAGLGEQLAGEEARLKEREKAPGKGFDFEGLLLPILDQACAPFHDNVDHIGAVATVGRSKKGDLLVELNPADTDGRCARIVIEAKRESRALTGKTGILQEMEAAMVNRNAQYAIAVFSDDTCPKNAGRLRAYPNNRLICSIAPDGSDSLALEIAYQLARTQLCWQLRHEGRGLDQARIAEVVKYAQRETCPVHGIKSQVFQPSQDG
jgi:hypothetical protein